MCKRQEILYTLTFWMLGCPKLQILRAVVITHSVLVVNSLAWEEWSADHLLHDHPVLNDLSAVNSDLDVPIGVSLGLTVRSAQRTIRI